MPKFIFLISLVLLHFFSSGQNTFSPNEKYIKHSSRAFSLYEKKEYLKSALSYDSLFKINKGQGLMIDRYNAACSWALAGNVEKAYYYLDKVVIADKFINLSHILSDSDLVPLHADKRWQPLIDTVKSNKEKAEANLNKPLAALLDTIYNEDQLDRGNIDTVGKQFGWQSRQMDSLWRKINYQDSINLIRVKNIIDTYGWLGPNEVGEQGASTIFLVIQHADSLTQVTYVPTMREAVKNGKARPQDLALLEDRILTKQGKEQIYGSQLTRNEQTGKYEFFPIQDEANVNKRRASVGLPPLEEYAKYFGLDYVLPKSQKPKK
ncbi:MAG: DUF6624 domain-containing protein [Flavitalea sp.]